MIAVLKQIFLGALVAGLRAGYIYNTWPLMEGRFIPPWDQLFNLTPWWSNWFDNMLTVQFDHRIGAYAVFILVLINALFAGRTGVARRGWALLTVVVVQIGLGIATLLLVVPLWGALLHQAFAMVVLSMAVVNLRAEFPARA